jgi:ubiquitin C-terminal hydrolase
MDLGVKLLKHHTNFNNTAANMIDLDINIRNANDKYIGLRNYGATCYMNSLLQQLYMITDFRNRLFQVQVDNKADNNPLYHLQLVFANLSQTLKLYHTPIHFIKSIKGFNNQPINTSQQQDCEEFLNILIDRLEPIVKDTEHVIFI